jgi:hypothetical protein
MPLASGSTFEALAAVDRNQTATKVRDIRKKPVLPGF